MTQTRRLTILAATLALLFWRAEPARAQHPVPPASGVWESGSASYALGAPARRQLLASLKRITGIEQIAFTADGRLEIGDVTGSHKGSSTAAGILRAALASDDVFVLEDYSNSDAVNFGQVDGMDYFNDTTNRHARVWWIRMDREVFRRIDAPTARSCCIR